MLCLFLEKKSSKHTTVYSSDKTHELIKHFQSVQNYPCNNEAQMHFAFERENRIQQSRRTI